MSLRLHQRLALSLLSLLLLLAAAATAFTLWSTRRYEAEAQQRLHFDLAHNIVAMKQSLLLGEDGSLRTDELGPVFHWLMVVNPDVELYVVGLDGRLLAWDAPPGAVVREAVDLEPLRRSLREGVGAVPLLGDDPRSADRRKVFSVATIPAAGPAVGYLYAILAGEQHTSVAGRLRASFILRRSLLLVVAAFAVAVLSGAVLFRSLTRPLVQLADRMRRWRAEETPAPPAPLPELELLEQVFAGMKERIEAQVDEIRAMESSRRELIASVSHDLRTPISSVRGYLETLALKGESLEPAERERYVGVALRQAERLARLVDELFELATLETGRVERRPERLSLAELVQDNLQRYQLQAQRQGVELAGSYRQKPFFIEGDLGLIDRALQNVLENALRFTPRDGRVAVELDECEDGRVVVRIADTGCGIDEAELPRIFDRFYRGQPHRFGDAGGAGLGLAIAKLILDLHRGDIRVESAVGSGTTFTLVLPAA